MLGDTVNVRAVRILLECNLVVNLTIDDIKLFSPFGQSTFNCIDCNRLKGSCISLSCCNGIVDVPLNPG